MKIGDLIKPENLARFMKWYIEATRPLEDDRLAYCHRSYGLVPKGIVEEIQAARRLKQKKATKRKSSRRGCFGQKVDW